MKKMIITEEERNRILAMHISKTKNHYLNEQPTDPITDFGDWFKKQNFKIPKAKTKITVSPTESDTLESIAKEYGVTVADILKDNPGKTNDNLIPGEILRFQGYDIEM